MKIKVLLLLALLAVGQAAFADAIPVGDGQITGSWSQNWIWQGTTIDSMTLQILSGSSSWENPIHGFNNGWTSTGFSATVVSAGGPAGVNFSFITDFTGNMSDPLSYRAFGYRNGQLIDVGVLSWNGQNWTAQAEDPSTVPEPATLALLGSGLTGIWGLRRRFTH